MTSSEPVIRPATAADSPMIAEIYAENVAAFDATADLEPRPAGYFEHIIATQGQRESLVVLETGGIIAGWGRIMAYSDRKGYSRACETAVYLRRSMRRRGLGSFIKRHIIKACRELGYHHLVAKVYARNKASIEYNMQLGYELVGVQREICLVNGHWDDVAILQLVFDDAPPPDR